MQNGRDRDGDLLISIRANACGLVVLGAVHVGAVVKSPVSPPYGSPPPLVEEMPIEARKGSVLRALVLEEQRALLCPELLQVSEKTTSTNKTHGVRARVVKTTTNSEIRRS